MNLLKERILRDGICLPGGVLKVDGFINHQMDPALMRQMARELVNRFEGHRITKVMTIEASGIAPAIFVGDFLDVLIRAAEKDARCARHNFDFSVHKACLLWYMEMN